jgi:hypothetical protein
MEKDFVTNLLIAFFNTENNGYWILTNNKTKIRIEKFANKVNYQELNENGDLIQGYWLLEDKTLYGHYTDHMK